nr:MAG TPA: hypothetical protein [Caudoviricetes sp.]
MQSKLCIQPARKCGIFTYYLFTFHFFRRIFERMI